MKETIKNKITELRKLKEKAISQVNALNGAIQVLEELLKEDEEKEKEVKEG